jgi:hypothetical protein
MFLKIDYPGRFIERALAMANRNLLGSRPLSSGDLNQRSSLKKSFPTFSGSTIYRYLFYEN